MNTRVIGVVVMALVLATTAVVADAEVAVANANADTEAQVEAQTQAQAENQAFMRAAAEALAATRSGAATESAAEATAEATAEAATEGAATESAEKPKDAKAKDAPNGTFKPTIINRDTRLAMRSQRSDIRYPDGALAPILAFGPRPARQGVDADVVSFPADSPLARRFARWAGAAAEKQKKFVTPTYEDQLPRQNRNRNGNRYVSFVPNAAFYAPRRPTHFEPEYTDEHHLLSGDFAAYFASLGAPVMARGTGAGAAPVQARGPRTFEAEYDDEHALLSGELPSLPANLQYVFDVDVDDLLNYERAVYRGRPSAYDMYGLPEFPDMPASAAHLKDVPPFSGLDDPISPVPSGVHTKVAYPTGSGAKADLQKLDFALNRLATLNAQLRVAEQRVRESRAEQKVLQQKLQRLNVIRANLQKLAGQIAALETRVGQNPTVQAEVARVAASKVQGVPVLGEWLKFN